MTEGRTGNLYRPCKNNGDILTKEMGNDPYRLTHSRSDGGTETNVSGREPPSGINFNTKGSGGLERLDETKRKVKNIENNGSLIQ